MRSALLLAVLLLACDGPTGPRELWSGTLQTAVGAFEASAPPELLPALRDGLEGASASCLASGMHDLGWPRERFAGTLDGWRIDVRGRGSEILYGPRRMLIDATGPDGTRNGAWHECMTALAYALHTCPHLSKIGLCDIWGPGYTIGCKPC